MGKNTGEGYRKGAVKHITQFARLDGHFQKRAPNGQFDKMKNTDGPFKGVAKEPDGRDTDRSPKRPN